MVWQCNGSDIKLVIQRSWIGSTPCYF